MTQYQFERMDSNGYFTFMESVMGEVFDRRRT